METVVTKWVEESVPAATFDVPAGYTEEGNAEDGRLTMCGS